MKYLKFFENLNSKLYWEIEERDFYSSEIIDEDMSKSIQSKIKGIIKDEFIFSIKKKTGPVDKEFSFVKINYDLNKSTIHSRKFECSIFQTQDDYFLVEFGYWFGTVGGEWSTKYFQCDAFEGLYNLLQELGLAK